MTVPCAWCGRTLTYTTLEVDRWPRCGHAGGRYTRDNVIPSCSRCNKKRCQSGRDRDSHAEPLDNRPPMGKNLEGEREEIDE